MVRLMKQKHSRSCGPTAVVNLLRMLGYEKFSYRQIRNRIETLPTGTPLSNIGPELRRLIGKKYVVRSAHGSAREMVDHLNAGYHAVYLYATRYGQAHYVAIGPRGKGNFYTVANDLHDRYWTSKHNKTVKHRRRSTLITDGRKRVAHKYNLSGYPYYWLVKPRSKK